MASGWTLGVLALFAACALSACGGQSTQHGGAPAPATGGASGSGGVGADPEGAGAGGRPIPQRLCNTWADSSCIEGDACTCRDDPRPECQVTASCVNGAWQLVPATCEEPPEPVQCPTTPEAARDMPCDTSGAACEYPGDLACYCQVPFDLDAYVCRIHNGAVGPVPLLWYCGEGGDRTGCPVGIPAIGTPCMQEEQHCGNPCANQYARRCRAGAWERWLPEHECL